MTYLLDTSTCVALIRRRPAQVRHRLERALAAGAVVAVPTVALFELWFGVAKSPPEHRDGNRARLEAFEATLPLVLDLSRDDARRAGLIRAALQERGTPIGVYDLLIAGQAVNRALTVVTGNLGEFRRIDGLACESWAPA